MSIASSTPSNPSSPTHGGFFLSEEEDYVIPFADRCVVVGAKLDLKEEKVKKLVKLFSPPHTPNITVHLQSSKYAETTLLSLLHLSTTLGSTYTVLTGPQKYIVQSQRDVDAVLLQDSRQIPQDVKFLTPNSDDKNLIEILFIDQPLDPAQITQLPQNVVILITAPELFESYKETGNRVFVCWDGDKTQISRMEVMTDIVLKDKGVTEVDEGCASCGCFPS